MWTVVFDRVAVCGDGRSVVRSLWSGAVYVEGSLSRTVYG